MSKFAEYAPEGKRESPLCASNGLSIRPLLASDLAQVARLQAQREGGDPDAHLESLSREFAANRGATGSAIWVAALGDRVIGFARASYFSPPAGAPAGTAPEGWYLLGLIVDPEFRRRGVGIELTHTRLQWIAQRSENAYYFASARNLPTIDLHRRLGFTEVTRSFVFPGVSFTGEWGFCSSGPSIVLGH